MAVSNTSGLSASYKYDPFGRRIEKTVNGVTTKYLYDGPNILYQYDGSNNITARYIHNLGIDDPLGVVIGGQVYVYHKDTLGSIRTITNSSKAVVNTYTYDSFGNVTQTGTLNQPYAYTGREYDSETGLYYYRARYYDPKIGRFISKDPIGFAGGDVNLYAYVLNNPINRIDPFGLDWRDVPGALYKAITVGAKAGYNASTSAYTATVNMAINGPPASRATLGLAATTVVAPLVIASAPESIPAATCEVAKGYRWGMAAAGTEFGQSLLKNAPDFIDAWMPGDNPANQSPGGFWGWATKSSFEFGKFIGSQIDQRFGR